MNISKHAEEAARKIRFYQFEDGSRSERWELGSVTHTFIGVEIQQAIDAATEQWRHEHAVVKIQERDKRIEELEAKCDNLQTDIEGLCHMRAQENVVTAEDEAEIQKLRYYLERAGWGQCDIPACNCGGYHKLRESRDEIEKDKRIAELESELKRSQKDEEALATELTVFENALIGNQDCTKKGDLIDRPRVTLERVRDLIAAEGEAGDAKEEIQKLHKQLQQQCEKVMLNEQRIEAMAKLLDMVPHRYGGIPLVCWQDCPRCAWEKLKAK